MDRRLPDVALGVEWAVLELVARGAHRPEEQALVRDLLTSESLSWGELLEQAIRHQMLPILAHAVAALELRFDVPFLIAWHLDAELELNRWRLQVFRGTAAEVASAFGKAGIRLAGTKGIALESTVYDGNGARYMKDVDLMIAPSDRERALRTLRELGFEESYAWARDQRREEIAVRLNPDHLPKMRRATGLPVINEVYVDVANSLTWTRSPFDVPVEEALSDLDEQPLPGLPDARLPVMRPAAQLAFTALHLFREAWLRKFAEAGTDVTLMKFADVLRLVERGAAEIKRGDLSRWLDRHAAADAVAWVLAQVDEVFGARTRSELGLDGRGEEGALAAELRAPGYWRGWSGTMRERLHAKDRGRLLERAP